MNQVAAPQATSLIKSAIKSPIIVALDNMDERQAPVSYTHLRAHET